MNSYSEEPRHQSYRIEKSFEERSKESTEILAKDKERIPIIVEKAPNEKFLPPIPRNKFLIPRSTTLGHLHNTIRVRLQLHQDQSFFLIVAGRHMPTLTTTIEQVYNEHKAEDGFLYMQYVSQEVFG